MAVSTSWMLFAVLLFGHATTQGSNNFTETELFSKMKEDLVKLCPKTDICNRNSTVLQNGLNAGNNDVCCQSCSCDEDCYENMNCCFPEDDDNRSGVEDKFSSMECLYVQTGRPVKSWTNTVPAYLIVSSAPREGCLQYKPSESPLRQDTVPSCDDEPVAVWGNLFPVYSQEHNKIYKNAECALCHNATKIIKWSPILICNDTNENLIGVSQILQFLQLNLRNANCYVTFRYKDPTSLTNERCYKEPVSSCPLTSQIDTSTSRTDTDLLTAEIREACESGFESLVMLATVAYRNIYCYLCNAINYRSRRGLALYCSYTEAARTNMAGAFALLLDAEYFKTMNNDGRSDEKRIFPQACIVNGHSLASKSCRDILCPSGQIRITRTGCKFPSTNYYMDAVATFLRLRYTDEQGSILKLLTRGTVKKADIKEGLLESYPWSSQWDIVSVFHTNESLLEKSLLVYLVSKITSPAILYHSIERYIAKPWTVNLNGSSFNFEQSFSEYRVSSKVQGAEPSWIRWANNASLQQMNISNPESHSLHTILKGRLLTRPRLFSKLFVCEQIPLYSWEFKLIANNLVLISNLTTRTLYDMEFELFNDLDNTVNVRVCTSDTVFEIKNATNGSKEKLLVNSTISISLIIFVWIFV